MFLFVKCLLTSLGKNSVNKISKNYKLPGKTNCNKITYQILMNRSHDCRNICLTLQNIDVTTKVHFNLVIVYNTHFIHKTIKGICNCM